MEVIVVRTRESQLQDVKSHFSDVVRRAQAGEATIVTRRGERAAVVIGIEEYERLTHRGRTLLDVLRSAPPMDDLPLERNRERVRPVDLED